MDDYPDANTGLARWAVYFKDRLCAMELENKALKEENEAAVQRHRIWEEQRKIREQTRRREILKWWSQGDLWSMAGIVTMLANEFPGTKMIVHFSPGGIDITWPTKRSRSVTPADFTIEQPINAGAGGEERLQTMHKNCCPIRRPKQVYTVARCMTAIALTHSSHAQPIPSGHMGDSSDQNLHRVSARTQDMITVFLLLYPPVILLVTVKVAHTFHGKRQDGRTACSMLLMAFIFAGVSDEGGFEKYAKIVIGLTYAVLMGTYCEIKRKINGWGREGCITVAGALAGIMVMSALSLAPVWTYVSGLGGASIFFGLSLAVPLAVTVYDTASFLLPKIVVVIRTLSGSA